MSRVGKKIIDIPSDVTVSIDGNTVTVKGPKGELSKTLNERMTYKQDENTLEVVRPSDSKDDRTVHGTTRALINNMILGVSQGFQKTLELVGVGYRAAVKGKILNLVLGYSHPIDYELPEGVTAETPSQTDIILKSYDKALLGQVAAKVRAFRAPEPYKGKGVRYADEIIHIKEAKKK